MHSSDPGPRWELQRGRNLLGGALITTSSPLCPGTAVRRRMPAWSCASCNSSPSRHGCGIDGWLPARINSCQNFPDRFHFFFFFCLLPSPSQSCYLDSLETNEVQGILGADVVLKAVTVVILRTTTPKMPCISLTTKRRANGGVLSLPGSHPSIPQAYEKPEKNYDQLTTKQAPSLNCSCCRSLSRLRIWTALIGKLFKNYCYFSYLPNLLVCFSPPSLSVFCFRNWKGKKYDSLLIVSGSDLMVILMYLIFSV